MTSERFQEITGRYAGLSLAIIGDFCLDRYLEIDPARGETSIETGLPVYNVTRVRSQPGGAGTVLNNLVALGIGKIFPVGVAGQDGEGFELIQALKAKPGVRLDHFIQTNDRRTFTYTKPLVMEPGAPPRELNRLDIKNWSATPGPIQSQLIQHLQSLAGQVDGLIFMEQVDVAETGVITEGLLKILGDLARQNPDLLAMADSRRGLRHFPPVIFKMNRTELGRFLGGASELSWEDVKASASRLAAKNRQRVLVTLAEQGILGADPDGAVCHVPCLPIRGEIDIVGAGDAVTANLVSALAGGATTLEAITIANAAASVVIHQLGTTGSASPGQIREALWS